MGTLIGAARCCVFIASNESIERAEGGKGGESVSSGSGRRSI